MSIAVVSSALVQQPAAKVCFGMTLSKTQMEVPWN